MHKKGRYINFRKMFPTKGEEHPLARLKNKDILYIRKKFISCHKDFGCIPLAKKYKISINMVYQIINRTCWGHI
jgi:Mor family transcriptional regulator